MAQPNALPLISAVMVVYARSDLLPIVMETLALQSIARTMEIILVAESRAALAPILGTPHPFFNLRIVEAGDIRETGQAKALGVRAARAPLVMFLEDHSFPDPGCAKAMVARHEAQKPAAVGPVMLNANPSSAVSWGTFPCSTGNGRAKTRGPKSITSRPITPVTGVKY